MYNSIFTEEEKSIIEHASDIIKSKIRKIDAFQCPQAVVDFCKTKLVTYEHEVFGILLLDNQNCLIEFTELFRGTISSASVYPREVVKLVLHKNAANIIITHNHPSGLAEPSQADQLITKKLSQALNLIDVRILDHIVIGTNNTVSFAERGLL